MSHSRPESPVQAAREALDAWVREVVAWHFDPATGSPFWLDYAGKLGWDKARNAASDAWHRVERALPGDFDGDGR